jgi:TonB family protein
VTTTWDPSGPPQAELRWRTTLVLSLVLHAAGFGAALGLPRLLPRGSQGPSVYVVDLVSLPAGPVTASPAAPPAAPKAAPPPPKAEKPIALPERQPKKTPAKKPPAPRETEKRSETKAPDPARQPAKETPPPKTGPEGAAAATTRATGAVPGDAGTRAGGAGGTGGRASDEYNFYLSLVKRKIDAAWKKPLDPTGQAIGSLATITLTLSSSGRVTRLDLTRPSGFDSLDRSVLRAVQDAEPFPPFPYQLGVDTLTVNFEFVLTP